MDLAILPILAIYFEEELLLPSQLLVRQFALHLKRKSSGILLIDYLGSEQPRKSCLPSPRPRYQIYVVLGLFDSPVPKKKYVWCRT